MRFLITLLGVGLGLATSGRPAAALVPSASTGPPRIANYQLTSSLDTERHLIKAQGILTWTNASSKPQNELWFHLYLNAFKNDGSLFLRSPFRAGRGGKRGHAYGYIDVERMIVRSTGQDLWPLRDRNSPGEPNDETDIRVPLPVPVAPGESIELELSFQSQLPEVVERTGHSGSYHLVAQWFPKVARLEPDGTWQHFAFDPQSEFYADFGDYRVELDVPEAYKVGATGRITAESVSLGRRRLTFEAEAVHDFAWTAYDRFEEWSTEISGVAVHVLYPPGYEAAIDATLHAIRFALPDFNRRYGAYPYPTLTVVHPPDVASRTQGMEYPTLITTGGPWYAQALGVRAAEIVTVHELGHQWFYGLLASNEHASPFLDEGVNSYAEGLILTAAYGNGSLLSFMGVKVSIAALRRAQATARAHAAAVASPAAEFASFTDLGALVYSRTATVLDTLAAVYGEERMASALSDYAARYRFRHPRPPDLFAALGAHLGESAETLAKLALGERGWVDFVAESLESVRKASPSGIFDRDGQRQTVARGDSVATDWVSSVTVYRHGSLVLPVEVEMIAEDGARIRRFWDGAGSHVALTHAGPSPITAVVVDPDRRVLLDQNFLNNSATETRSLLPRLWERGLYLAALLLGMLGP